CLNGSSPQPEHGGSRHRCYDLISLSVDAGFELQGGSPRLDVNATFTTPRPGDVYHPFGLEWFGIDDARLRLALGFDAGGALNIEAGVQGDVLIGQTDLFAAVQLDVAVLSQAPWIRVQ